MVVNQGNNLYDGLFNPFESLSQQLWPLPNIKRNNSIFLARYSLPLTISQSTNPKLNMTCNIFTQLWQICMQQEHVLNA